MLSSLYARAVSPNHSFGRSLLRARMQVQSVRYAGDRDFLETLRMVVPRYSMIDVHRLRSLYDLAYDVNRRRVEGAIVECGTWNGGSAAMMASGAPNRDVWLFDSFEGLPKPTANDPQKVHDLYFEGWCAGSPALAREILLHVGVSVDRMHIVKGWYQDTLPAKTGPIAILHIDSDWYESVRQCLKLYDQVVSGGVIVFDDYDTWSGCKKAVDEFVWANRLDLKSRRYLVKPDGA